MKNVLQKASLTRKKKTIKKKSYRSVFLINTDIKPNLANGALLKKYRTNLRPVLVTTISKDAGKGCCKTQHSFPTETPNKPGTAGLYQPEELLRHKAEDPPQPGNTCACHVHSSISL